MRGASAISNRCRNCAIDAARLGTWSSRATAAATDAGGGAGARLPGTGTSPRRAIVAAASHKVTNTSLHALACRVLFFTVHPAAAAAQSTGPAPLVSVTAIIPARFDSSRLPGKPLADICGRPMIEHVYRRASAATMIDRVIVATDDPRILDTVRSFGGEARMTRRDHPTGSDRLAEVAREPHVDRPYGQQAGG